MNSQYKFTHLFVNFNTTGITAAKFRKVLLNLGFIKYDVHTYHRPTAPDKVDSIITAIKGAVVSPMTVHVMRVTDKQWTDTKVIIGYDKSGLGISDNYLLRRQYD